MVDRAADRQRLEAGFRVGIFHAEPQRMRIVNVDTGLETRVEPKVMDVLVHLAEHAGSTVAKKQFMGAVWDATIVTDDALLRCISELRKIFGDDPRDPRYIETIRKKGYRLIAPVGFEHAVTPLISLPDAGPVDRTPGPPPRSATPTRRPTQLPVPVHRPAPKERR